MAIVSSSGVMLSDSTDTQSEISLNGGIVANKGFIRQMARPGTTELPGSYVSVWGGIQSAGQTVGQIVSTVIPVEFKTILITIISFFSTAPILSVVSLPCSSSGCSSVV